MVLWFWCSALFDVSCSIHMLLLKVNCYYIILHVSSDTNLLQFLLHYCFFEMSCKMLYIFHSQILGRVFLRYFKILMISHNLLLTIFVFFGQIFQTLLICIQLLYTQVLLQYVRCICSGLCKEKLSIITEGQLFPYVYFCARIWGTTAWLLKCFLFLTLHFSFLVSASSSY
jgi:hypothetical protein